MSTLRIWIVGATGQVGACTLAGWAAVRAKLIPTTGLITTAEPLADLPLVGLGDVVFGGHDVTPRPLSDGAAIDVTLRRR